MASKANTAFEVSVSNITRNNIQNVPGIFGAGTGTDFESEICPAGTLCVPQALVENEGYTGILNGNTWQMVVAADGAAGRLGDHTGIYAFNSYDVRKVQSGNNVWALGANFLGLELPAGAIGDFTEIIINEQYTFGVGAFTTAPVDATYIYATIDDGYLVASDTAPSAGDGVYFKILRTKSFTEGTRYAGFDGYVCQALRA